MYVILSRLLFLSHSPKYENNQQGLRRCLDTTLPEQMVRPTSDLQGPAELPDAFKAFRKQNPPLSHLVPVQEIDSKVLAKKPFKPTTAFTVCRLIFQCADLL